MTQKERTPIGEYVEQMRLRRDPPPSLHFMATDAGLSPSQVSQIVKGKIRKPTSDTLRKLCRRWGTPEDERELLRLAGRPGPMEDDGLTDSEKMILKMYHREQIQGDEWGEMCMLFVTLTPDMQRKMITLARFLARKTREMETQDAARDGKANSGGLSGAAVA